MHHLLSRDVTRKMVPRSPTDSPASLRTSSITRIQDPEISDPQIGGLREKRFGRKRPFWGTSSSKCRRSQKTSYAASFAPLRDSKDGA